MAEANVAQVQAQIDADPRVQAIVRDPTMKSRDKQTRLAQLQQQTQLPIPQGYYLNELGQVQKYRPGWEKYVAPLATAAAGFGAAALTAAAPVAGGGASTAATVAPDLTLADTGGVIPGLSVPSAMVPSSVAAAIPPAVAPGATAAATKIPWAPIVSGVGGALEGFENNRSASARQDKQIAADQALETQREDFTGQQNMATNALDESKLDPFRGQNAQGQAIAMADRRQNRMPIVPPAAVQPYMPTGGYTPSQDARDAAGKLKLSVMAGETAPSQLDPANYGKTGTIDATAPVDPTTGRAPFGGTPAFSYDSLFADPTAGQDDPTIDLIRRRIRQRAGVTPPTTTA